VRVHTVVLSSCIVVSGLLALSAFAQVSPVTGAHITPDIVAEELAVAWKIIVAVLAAFGGIIMWIAKEAWDQLKELTQHTVPELSAQFQTHAALTVQKFTEIERQNTERSQLARETASTAAAAVELSGRALRETQDTALHVRRMASRMGITD
jgi:hypothetical protein